MQSRLGRSVFLFTPVFVVSFLTMDYFWTGTVTNTWIGIAIIAALVVSLFRTALPGSREFDRR